MFLIALSLLTVLALLNRRAFPYVCVFGLNWIATAYFQHRDWWAQMPFLDAATFYGLFACCLFFPWRAGFVATCIGFLPLVCHLAYYWPQPEGVYYGVEYMYALQAISLASMAVLAWGGMNVRSIVGMVLEGVRRVLDLLPRPMVAREKAAEE